MNRFRFSLYPQFIFRRLEDITPGIFKQRGISFLMVDLDNTIAAYDEQEPSEAVLKWFDEFRSNDISLFLISNSVNEERVSEFAKALGVSYTLNARKPSPNGLRRAMGLANVKPEEAALIGDQVFTDAIAANLAGVVSILVYPIRFTNPFLAMRYFLELPFRRPKKRVAPAHLAENKEVTNE